MWEGSVSAVEEMCRRKVRRTRRSHLHNARIKKKKKKKRRKAAKCHNA